ncbi:hypothetical protein NDU88_002678 [Pleurodeles waltl]|uniref:Uncharacterized protein n=1 Tax=Pleurodeles waltl TaxID=8319 RepID=A0AAV7Q7D5_PLEWA|nr:hypothetical protein NDU88_002678 [Pleurodeles waltl]
MGCGFGASKSCDLFRVLPVPIVGQAMQQTGDEGGRGRSHPTSSHRRSSWLSRRVGVHAYTPGDSRFAALCPHLLDTFSSV